MIYYRDSETIKRRSRFIERLPAADKRQGTVNHTNGVCVGQHIPQFFRWERPEETKLYNTNFFTFFAQFINDLA